MSFLTEAKNGMKLAEHLNTGRFKSVLLPFWHGVGDVVMVIPIVNRLRELYPEITITLGLCRGLDQETFVPDAVLLDGDWREKALTLGYDLVFPLNFPLERLQDTALTKSEVSCIEEVGIEPVSGHVPIKAKKIVGLSFQCTSVPWVANTDVVTAEKVWNEVKEAGFLPIEINMKHIFFNPQNEKYPFIDNHVRDLPAKIETLISLIGTCTAYISAVSGNFHMALSVLGPKRVVLLEKDLKVGHFTKEPIARVDTNNYEDGKIKTFLASL